MEGSVAVTHSDWFDYLAQQPRREEVNFWSPSDYYAFHGTPGAPFFFKLTSPRNAVGGFGYVAGFTRQFAQHTVVLIAGFDHRLCIRRESCQQCLG